LRRNILQRSAAWQRQDRKLCDQIRESARSAPCNLAEGFGRFKPREFAHFARIARASLVETLNHLEEALEHGYVKPEEAESLSRLTKRALKATTRLLRYLDSCKGKAPTGWDLTDVQPDEPTKE
jgi:four helix bundle protein